MTDRIEARPVLSWPNWRDGVNRRARNAGWAFRENFTDAHESECCSLWREGKRPSEIFEEQSQ